MAETGTPAGRWSRRRMIIGGAAATATAAAAVALLRKGDHGGRHSDYFLALSRALRDAGIARPALVIDRARLRANIAALTRTLEGSGLATRVVVKSLPARGLLDQVAGGVASGRFMVFNGPMTLEMARWRPDADLLLGKPLAAPEVAATLDELASLATPGPGPQWLVDTPERIRQYAELARTRGRTLRINIEIDVGLHRGGFRDTRDLAAAIDLIRSLPTLAFSGLMGYDPHVPRAPSAARAYDAVIRRYAESVEVVRSRYRSDPTFTFNTAGSPTYALHARDRIANEVAVGSAFVKPRDFDTRTLTHHVPAAFIATPVLKALERTQIPGLESFAGVMTFLDANLERAFFIHGGHWLAEPESPPGLEFNPLFGRSSNQEMLNGSRSVALRADDYVFFRPTQSEAVLLQFGDLLVYDDGHIVERWPTFGVSA